MIYTTFVTEQMSHFRLYSSVTVEQNGVDPYTQSPLILKTGRPVQTLTGFLVTLITKLPMFIQNHSDV